MLLDQSRTNRAAIVNCLLSCCYPYLLDPDSNFRYPRKIENCKLSKCQRYQSRPIRSREQLTVFPPDDLLDGSSWRRSSAPRSRPRKGNGDRRLLLLRWAGSEEMRCTEARRKELAAPIGGEEKGDTESPDRIPASVNEVATWRRECGGRQEKSNPRPVGGAGGRWRLVGTGRIPKSDPGHAVAEPRRAAAPLSRRLASGRVEW